MQSSTILANIFLALMGMALIGFHDTLANKRTKKIVLWLGLIMVIPPLCRIFIEAILG